jgi:hypothetical protein
MIPTLRIRGRLVIDRFGSIKELDDALRQINLWEIGPVDRIVVDSIDSRDFCLGLGKIILDRLPTSVPRVATYIDRFSGYAVKIDFAPPPWEQAFDGCWRE